MEKSSLRTSAKAQWASAASYLSRAYVAGPELANALQVFDRLSRQGQSGTIGYFNTARQPAAEIAATNSAIIAALAAGRPTGYVSLKVPPLAFDLATVEAIARQAGHSGIGLHFDSHAIETTDPTFACIRSALPHTAQVGCTLPARWPRSLKDAEQAIALKLRIRVIKGQWADPEHPDQNIKAAYLALIDRLAGHARAVAVATHDPALAEDALRRLQKAGTPCELELLFGLPMRSQSALARKMGVPVRVYIPFGTAWLPYALGKLARKPSTLWWLLKDTVAASRWRAQG
jgi:proline dehydrogenase